MQEAFGVIGSSLQWAEAQDHRRDPEVEDAQLKGSSSPDFCLETPLTLDRMKEVLGRC
jgi:hypothetical protein